MTEPGFERRSCRWPSNNNNKDGRLKINIIYQIWLPLL